MPVLRIFGRDATAPSSKAAAARFGVTFDLLAERESAARRGHDREPASSACASSGLTYEKDGALWLRTTDSGDDEDRVVVRSDGRPTYFANDVAYHYDKLQRSRPRDRHPRSRSSRLHRAPERARRRLGRHGAIEVLIAQQITLKRGDEIVSMSKRAGEIVTLDEIIDEVGVDAARFFFVMLSIDQPLTFDLGLAKEQSNDNPSTTCSTDTRASRRCCEARAMPARWMRHAPRRLRRSTIGQSSRSRAGWPSSARRRRRRRAPRAAPPGEYARDVASDFHQFYTECRILDDDRAVRLARLALSVAAKGVLARTLALAGVSAPDSM